MEPGRWVVLEETNGRFAFVCGTAERVSIRVPLDVPHLTRV